MNDRFIPAPSSWRHLTIEHTEEYEAHAALQRIESSKLQREPIDWSRDYEAETRMNASELCFVVVVGVIGLGIVVALLFQNTPLGRWLA